MMLGLEINQTILTRSSLNEPQHSKYIPIDYKERF